MGDCFLQVGLWLYQCKDELDQDGLRGSISDCDVILGAENVSEQPCSREVVSV